MCYNANAEFGANKIRVAKKDITCYKFVDINTKYISNKDGEILLIPPYGYNRFRYRLGVIEKIAPAQSIFQKQGALPFFVHGGAFHSSLAVNRYELARWFNNFSKFKLVVKCTIPKGSKYCKNSHTREFISEQFRIDYISLAPKHWVNVHELDKFTNFLERHKDKFTLI